MTDLVLARVDQGRQLSRVRVRAGITLRELARQARLNPTVLSDVEQGRAEASERLKAIYARVAAS